MRSFWISLVFIVISWIGGLVYASADDGIVWSWHIATGACLFACYFLSPLFKSKPGLLTANLILASMFAAVSLWPDSVWLGSGSVMPGAESPANPFVLFILTLLVIEAINYKLPLTGTIALGTTQLLLCLAPMILADDMRSVPADSILFTSLYAAMMFFVMVMLRQTRSIAEDAAARNEALLDEYRAMKRRLATGEQLARQEERAQVGRDIHDSVGHKLTALLMQLEVLRMKTAIASMDENAQELQKLKILAQESLDETRNAVKALKADEPGGLPAIMRLIRKLEAESLLRVQFTVKHGAMSVPLTSEQAVAIYRGVQEGMTNILKHGSTREAEVLFEAPGGTVFRFEITNPRIDGAFREGFGLVSMRERIAQVGGKLEVTASRDRFMLRGTIPLHTPAGGAAE